MPVLPDNVCRLLSLHNLDVFIQERKRIDLKSLVVRILSMERAEEHLWDEQLLEVLILVICHLLLNLPGLLKVALAKCCRTLCQELLHAVVVEG